MREEGVSRKVQRAEPNKPSGAHSTGLAAWLFTFIGPQDATGVTVGTTELVLTTARGPLEVPMRNIQAIWLAGQCAWAGLRIQTKEGERRVSGLNRTDAANVAAAAQGALQTWWREHLREHAATAHRIDEKLKGLDSPTEHTGRGAFASLIAEVREEASSLPTEWPRQTNAEPAAQAIKRIQAFLSNQRAARERKNRIVTIARVDALLDELKQAKRYVRCRAFATLVKKAKQTTGPLPQWHAGQGEPEATKLARNRIRAFLSDPGRVRASANKAYLKAELKRARTFLDNVETHPLTAEQRRAVCVDDDRNLVVAAAGSGKTSVMVAKAGWLVERGDAKPEEVLLLAFARKARDELAERIERRLGEPVSRAMKARTFHSLGLAIIAEAEGRKPTLSKTAEDDKALFDVLKKIIQELGDHPEHGREVIRWLAYGATPYHSVHEFESLKEYHAYLRRHELRTLQGELVKSFEECLIANFLYLNGVRYEYERRYEEPTATTKRRQYAPDFYLPDADVYIEHFALSKDGRTPRFINRANYTAGREWKLRLHAEHGTKLIETFSHEQASGGLTSRLAKKLKAHGVVLKPLPRKQIFGKLEEQGRVPPLIRLTASFLQHFKGSGRPIEAVKEQVSEHQGTYRARMFVRIFAATVERYEKRLAAAGEIDFHDMINRAAEHVRGGRYRSPFRYILVDEFQDISQERARLVKALLDQTRGAQLLAVGDDWQAIYRFAGADISVMREFTKHFGAGSRTDLETTFRCSDGLSEIATAFVCRNPEQIRKKVRAINHGSGPGVRICVADDDYDSALNETLKMIATEKRGSERRPTVLLLGRYRNVGPQMGPLRRKYRELELSYCTVHAAKGLEADYAVVLGMRAGNHGFPSEVADDPLLELLLEKPDEYPNAEERRLLYVALTRAKRRTYLIDEKPRSSFIEELVETEHGASTFSPRADTGESSGTAGGRGPP